jgi:hypothetical protein
MSDGAAAVLVILFLVLGIGSLVLWIWALVDAVKVPHDAMYKTGNKLIWILVIVLAGVIGAIIYLIVGRPAPGAQPPATAFGGSAPPPPPPGALG